MNIILDLLVVLFFLGCIVSGLHKSRFGAVIALGTVIVSLAAACLLSVPFGKLIGFVVRPMVEKQCIKDTATMIGAPISENITDTLDILQPEKIYQLDTLSFAEMAEQYHFDEEEIKNIAVTMENDGKGSAETAKKMISKMSEVPAQKLSRLAAWVILYVVFYFILRGICIACFRQKIKLHHKKKFPVFAVILGVASGILMVAFLLVPCVQLLAACPIGFLKNLELSETMQRSGLFSIFCHNMLIK